jgi:hypothetical protein
VGEARGILRRCADPGPRVTTWLADILKSHLRAIYRKLGAESREEAVIRALGGGLI